MDQEPHSPQSPKPTHWQVTYLKAALAVILGKFECHTWLFVHYSNLMMQSHLINPCLVYSYTMSEDPEDLSS